MPDVSVVGEESADVCDESADGDGQCQSGGQNHQVAGEGTGAHVPGVVYPMEVADLYGYGRPDAIIYHEAGGTDARHDLMGGEGSGTNPTLHHGAQRKRSCLHAHLQSERPAQFMQQTAHVGGFAFGLEAGMIFFILFV